MFFFSNTPPSLLRLLEELFFFLLRDPLEDFLQNYKCNYYNDYKLNNNRFVFFLCHSVSNRPKRKKNLFLLMFCDNQFKNYSRVYTLSQLSHIFKKNCTQYMYELHILIFVCSKVLYWTEGTWTGGRRTNRYFQCIKVKKCYPNMASRAPSIFSFKSSSFSGNSIIIKMYICTYLVKL